MPPKRSNIGRLSSAAKRLRNQRVLETEAERERRLGELRAREILTRELENEEQRDRRLEGLRERDSRRRALESEEQRDRRLEGLRERDSRRRALESEEQRDGRLEVVRTSVNRVRAAEDDVQRGRRLMRDRIVHSEVRRLRWTGKEGSAFNYDKFVDYGNDKLLSLGDMTNICKYCSAKKWKDESDGMCCSLGKVRLEPLDPPPEPLLTLITTNNNRFLNLIRSYNAVFQMTSFGGKVCGERGYMPTFKVQGQIYHRIGSLLPAENECPQFLQLYFLGNSEEEARARCNLNSNIDAQLVTQLQTMLHQYNPYVRDFKATLEWSRTSTVPNLNIVIQADRKPSGEHGGRYNAPTTNEIAIVLVDQHRSEGRDIVIKTRTGQLQRISETNRAYDCLQYPLMFCHGEDGYKITLPLINPSNGQVLLNKKVSCMDFYAYRMMVRNVPNYLLYFRSLLNQFWVDMYAKIEGERLNFIKFNQAKLRAEDYIHLQDAIIRDGNVENAGQLVILPSSFIGSPRYMQEKMQDAMAYVRQYGRPDLFLTFTCNPTWEEIKRELLDGQKPMDRYDIISRVFRLKVKKLMHFIRKCRIFGALKCFTYSIEWQKRGLPHCHLLIWLEIKITSNQVDSFISAEIPDKIEDPLLYEVIIKNMIHGPCGTLDSNSVCMKNGRCSKKFPKKFVSQTQTAEDGYPLYMRRSPSEGGRSFKKKIRSGLECEIDNRWVVPYCPLLSRMFKAHINLEYCHSVKAIKYICKYINKGSDQATIMIGNADLNVTNEVNVFQTGRYISSSEAVWRILSFPIVEHHPTVVKLQVHLENGQRVYFRPGSAIQDLQAPPKSTLLGFFDLCREDEFARTLLYHQVPQYYTLNPATKKFIRRKQGTVVDGYTGVYKTDTIGRVYTVHPNYTECYFLRMLLHTVIGPTSFNHLKTVDGQVCDTYQIACQRLGLLENDDHWDKAIQEAAIAQTPHQLRYLFAIMLAVCQVTNPKDLWEKYKECFAEDILYQHRIENDMQLTYSTEIFDRALFLLQKTVATLTDKQLSDFGMPQPVSSTLNVTDEYIIEDQFRYVQANEGRLTDEQKIVYNEILDSVNHQKGKLYFLDAPGGTGKTFLINLILAKLRSANKVTFPVASCGIAATLMQGGKTAHSTFKLPLNLHHQDQPVCNLKRGSKMARLIRDCALIVWDECTMSNKAAVEAVDRSLRDLTGKNVALGGITVLFSGDFRQTLPVVEKGTRADEVNSCLKSSYIWPQIRQLHLTTNMRVQLQQQPEAEYFSKLLMDIGDGKCIGEIEIPPRLGKTVNTIDNLISAVYPQLTDLQGNPPEWYCERAILCPKNDSVSSINTFLLNSCSGNKVVYTSIDTTLDSNNAVNFPTEFLNSLELPGLPPHKLELKVHAPIMLLRNLDAPRLCNGTRLQITNLQPNVIQAKILTGCAKGETVFIPRIPLIPQNCPYEFKRLQFPVRLSFSMTVNKAQGQTLKVVGVDLRVPCFSHGQLYVASSRATGSDGLFFLIPNKKTDNIVYPEVLNRH